MMVMVVKSVFLNCSSRRRNRSVGDGLIDDGGLNIDDGGGITALETRLSSHKISKSDDGSSRLH